jgi:hypothetical protein
MELIDNIKFLFEQIENKTDFYDAVSKEFGVEVDSVRVGWFYRFALPKKYKVKENLITFMQNYIANKNKN